MLTKNKERRKQKKKKKKKKAALLFFFLPVKSKLEITHGPLEDII